LARTHFGRSAGLILAETVAETPEPRGEGGLFVRQALTFSILVRVVCHAGDTCDPNEEDDKSPSPLKPRGPY
jgi:hypothetical protein